MIVQVCVCFFAHLQVCALIAEVAHKGSTSNYLNAMKLAVELEFRNMDGKSF